MVSKDLVKQISDQDLEFNLKMYTEINSIISGFCYDLLAEKEKRKNIEHTMYKEFSELTNDWCDEDLATVCKIFLENYAKGEPNG